MGAENKEFDEELEDDTLDTEGTENQNDDAGADDGKGKNETSETTKEKTFTQAQVTRMMSKEKRQGKNSVYKELGIDPKDTKMIAMFKAFVSSQKSEDEKAAEKKAEDDAKYAEAEKRALTAELKAEAMMMGVEPQYVDDIVTLAMSKMTDEDADVKVIIGEFKKKYPVWFKESDEGSETAGKRGTGSSVGNKSRKGSTGGEKGGIGARLAAQRKQNNSSGSKSFWS